MSNECRSERSSLPGGGSRSEPKIHPLHNVQLYNFVHHDQLEEMKRKLPWDARQRYPAATLPLRLAVSSGPVPTQDTDTGRPRGTS